MKMAPLNVIPAEAGIQQGARRAPVHTNIGLGVGAHGMRPRIESIFEGTVAK
jgi:hypothetical protein